MSIAQLRSLSGRFVRIQREDELLADPRLTIVGLFVEAVGGLLTRLGSVHAAHGFAGSITRIVDRLESQGLIRREMCAGDRRATWAVLTDEGDARLRAELPQLIDAIQECLVDPLTGPHWRAWSTASAPSATPCTPPPKPAPAPDSQPIVVVAAALLSVALP